MPTTWDSSDTTPYESYWGEQEYEIQAGNYALPVAIDPADIAAGDSPVEVVQAHAPFRIRKALFSAKKANTPPVIPSPESSGSFTFLRGLLKFNQPTLNTDMGSYVWAAQGSYFFVEAITHDVSNGFLLMTLPFSTAIQQDITTNGFGNQIISQGNGAVANSGTFGRAGWELSQNLNFADGSYTYDVYTYWPGAFFNKDLLNGGTPASPVILQEVSNPNMGQFSEPIEP